MKTKTIIVIAIIALFGLSLIEKPSDTKTWVSNDMNYIKTQIDTWSKYGYKVEEIITQSVSISEASAGGYQHNISKLKGDVLLVMTK